MSTPKQRKAKTEERGLLTENLHPKVSKEAEAATANPGWAELVAKKGGSPFLSKEFLTLVANGRAGYPALGGAWPKDGQAREWREFAEVRALDIAYLLGVPAELVEIAWEEGGQEPNPDNWRGGDYDDLAARRLYAAMKSYRQNGPYAPAPAPEPKPERPPVDVLMSEGFPGKQLLEAANLGYSVDPSKLSGEGNFLRVVVAGEVVGIPVLRDVPAGSELKRIREECNYSQERWGVLLGAAASRVDAWENELALPGADVSNGGLPAALRLYGTCETVLRLRKAKAA